MKIENHEITDVKIIRYAPRTDARGSFARVWDRDIFSQNGCDRPWIQENQALTLKANTLRGMHYQTGEFAETKLLRCLNGRILDLFVDLRAESPTFGQAGCFEMSATDMTAICVPRGFAHGYLSLTDDVVVSYKVDAPYSPQHEGGIRWNDPMLKFPCKIADPALSEKDANWPWLTELPRIAVTAD